MFSLAAFIGYLLSFLFLKGWIKSFSIVLFFAVYLVLFEYKEYHFNKRRLTIYLITGLLSGILFSSISTKSYSKEAVDYPEELTAKVIAVTPSSIFLESKTFNRKSGIQQKERFKIKNEEKSAFVFDTINLKCFEWKSQSSGRFDNIFTALENLRGIHRKCLKPELISIIPANAYLARFRFVIKNFIGKRLTNIPPGSYASGFLLSDSSAINPVELKIFRKMGVAHLFSPSGLHMGLLYGTCTTIFKLLKIPAAGTFMGLFFCLAYLIVLDFRISLLRAFVFLVIYLLLKFMNRKTEGRYVLYLTTIILEVIFPLSCFSASFILSFIITLVIIIFYPRYRVIVSTKRDYFKQHLSLTLSAYTASAYLSLVFFSYFHPLSFLYNLALVPLAGLYLGSVFIYLGIPSFKYLILTGDFIFKHFALLHFNFLEKHLPGINLKFSTFWMVLFFVLTVYFVLYTDKQKYWYLRKYYFKIYLALSVLYLGNHIIIQYPLKTFLAFPYGVIYYENRHVYIDGTPDRFIKPRLHHIMGNISYPFQEVHANRHFIEDIHLSLLPRKYPVTEIKSGKYFNLVNIKNHCFMFPYKNKYISGIKDGLKTCHSIYLVHGKNHSPDMGFYNKVIKKINPGAEIKTIGYMKWYQTNEIEKNTFWDNIYIIGSFTGGRHSSGRDSSADLSR